MSKSKRVLIVEDDANIALAVKMVLRKPIPGAEVTIAGDGQEAWENLQQNDYDLVISDWNMPHITGQELLGKVRANQDTERLPFLMLTARPDAATAMQELSCDVTDYIPKPFDNGELVERVARLLELAEAG